LRCIKKVIANNGGWIANLLDLPRGRLKIPCLLQSKKSSCYRRAYDFLIRRARENGRHGRPMKPKNEK
jgi:hypothetical protein